MQLFARHRINKKATHALQWLSVSFLGFCTIIAAQSAICQEKEQIGLDPVPVLVINSYHQNYEWTRHLLEGLESSFAESPRQIKPYYEFLDVRQFEWNNYQSAFTQYLNDKYKTTSQLVVVTDNAAFDFVLAHRDTLFPDIPIVFAGVNNLNYIRLLKYDRVYGVEESPDVAGTMSLIENLHPNNNQLLVLGDSSHSGKQVMQHVKQVLSTDFSHFDVDYFSDWSRAELEYTLESRAKDRVVLSLGVFNDNEKRFYPVNEMVKLVRELTDSPIYSMWKNQIQLGFTGGVVIDGYGSGYAAGQLGLKVLAEQPIEETVLSTPTMTVLNYEARDLLPLKGSLLPREIQWLHKPESFYQRHKAALWWSVVLILLQGLVVLALFLNVRYRRVAESELKQRANFDLLTGLPNRHQFEKRLHQAILSAKKCESSVHFVFLDVDSFKQVNEHYGHQFGDELLERVGERLQELLPDYAVAARLTGDEFAVFITDDHVDDQRLQACLLLLTKGFDRPFSIGYGKPWIGSPQLCYMTSSLGVASFPGDGETVEELMRHADVAMLQAKKQKKTSSRYAFFSKEVSHAIRRRASIENYLRLAMERSEFSILYQPIVNQIGKVVGCEALLRWWNAELGRVSPEEFIPVAEDSGWVVPIGEWVLNQAAQELMRLHQSGHAISMAVNISYRQFQDRRILKSLNRIERDFDVPLNYLHLEITERLLVENVPDTQLILEEIRSFGVKVAIDDFGTGYSSLSYLTNYHFDLLKIDRSFIEGMAQSEQKRRLVEGIKSIADQLSMDIVVEGVELEGQWRSLLKMSFWKYQGNLFSKPLSQTNFYKLMDKAQPPPIMAST